MTSKAIDITVILQVIISPVVNCCLASFQLLIFRLLVEEVYFESGPENIPYVVVVVAIVVLLIAALIVIFVCRCHRQKQRRRNLEQRCKLDDGDMFDKHPSQELRENGRNVLLMSSLDRSNHEHDRSDSPEADPPKPSPQPPPLPRRPVSYTPSAADSFNTLNVLNADVARNYGSAADDLENAGTCKRTETPVFLQNCEVQKSPRTVRMLPKPPIDEDPTLKNLNNLNKVENYRKSA